MHVGGQNKYRNEFIILAKYEPANDNMNTKDWDNYHDSSCNIYQVGH